MNYQEIIQQVSEEINLPPIIVDKVYKSYWRFIRDTIQPLPLKKVKLETDFNKLRTNFNIPSLGKLSVSWDRINKVNARFNYIKKLQRDD